MVTPLISESPPSSPQVLTQVEVRGPLGLVRVPLRRDPELRGH